MRKRIQEFQILDKDLGRVSNAEYASVESSRPLIRFGLALTLVALAVLAATGLFGSQPEIEMVLAGVAVSAFLALSIGANDVANSLGPAVGAEAIGMNTGLILVGIMLILGAVLAGTGVSGRLADGIIMPSMTYGTDDEAEIMVAALFAAATWISLATWAGAPISTTHSIVGAIMGAGITAVGWQAVNWLSIASIAAGWIVSPLAAGALAAGLLALFRVLIYDAPQPLNAARRHVPWMIALMVALFVDHIVSLGTNLSGWTVAAISAVAGAAGWVHARRAITQQIASKAKPRAALKAVFRLPLAAAALLMGFGIGANDGANVIAPLSTILKSVEFGNIQFSALAGAAWMPLLAGLGIAAGANLFGRKLIHMVGSRITRLNSHRAFCVSLATAITVIVASALALPVSSTHIAVGGVFGVGFYREWLDSREANERAPLPAEERMRRQLVRRSHVRTIFGAWLITAPVAALMAAGAVLLIP